MAVIDEFLDAIRLLLADAGIDLELGVLRAIFWIVLAAIVIATLYQLGRAMWGFGSLIFGFIEAQIEGKFWRHPGKLATVISFGLLAIAYGFYGGDQTRMLDEALLDLGREQLLAVMPLAILTQWILLCLFWTTFGLIMGISFQKLIKPVVSTVVGMAVFAAYLVQFAVGIMAMFDGNVGLSLFGFGSMVALNFVLMSISYARQAGRPRPGPPVEEAEPPGYWRTVTMSTLVITGLLVILFGILAVVIAAVYAESGSPAPSLAGVVKAALIAVSVIFLFTCYRFRFLVLEDIEVPPALFHFIDLSLALAAGVIALAGLPNSTVTLGPVPVWLIAIGPPLIVGATIFGYHLYGLRASTPRWPVCLTTSGVGAVVVWPATLGLTAALVPLMHLLNVPVL